MLIRRSEALSEWGASGNRLLCPGAHNFSSKSLWDSTSLFCGAKTWSLVQMAIPSGWEWFREVAQVEKISWCSFHHSACKIMPRKMLDLLCILGSSFPSPFPLSSVLCARWLHFITEFIKFLGKQGMGRWKICTEMWWSLGWAKVQKEGTDHICIPVAHGFLFAHFLLPGLHHRDHRDISCDLGLKQFLVLCASQMTGKEKERRQLCQVREIWIFLF